MASWTPERSAILSLLLDEVSGTEEMVNIRQDFCKVRDCIESSARNTGVYFTGSKAEGLDLPGSDYDYMFDINGRYNIRVAQTQETRVMSSPYTATLLLCTDGVQPGFALLRWLSPIPHPLLMRSSRNINSVPHLSSFLFMREHLHTFKSGDCYSRVIQGPSIELWSEYEDRSKSGDDNVPSIHCPFWPRGAEEWLHRPRHCGWPTPADIAHIADFGCHIVAVGFPLSSSQEMEWRISFSVAERILVWSFNHIQIQCYALMKIILKEYIKVRCSPQNNVLCSYFIKTFLFWKFEVTESTFWRADNFRDCVSFVLVEFTKCIRDGELPHYFFPEFNLLSVKLRREAQRELLQLFETAIEHDIAILRECNTLRKVWSQLTTTDVNINHVTLIMNRTSIFRNDECIMEFANDCYFHCSDLIFSSLNAPSVTRVLEQITTDILAGQYTTSLVSLVLRYLVWRSNIPHRVPGNRDVYKLYRLAHSDVSSFDISTCKLWHAMILLMRKDYAACLRTVNDVLSRIPPFALYMSGFTLQSSRESKSLYERVYLQSDADVMERLRTAWLRDLKYNINVPLAIYVELFFCDENIPVGVPVSPFVFAYYLLFLCHHELHQYDDRHRALRLLVDTVNNPEQRGVLYHRSLNIMGHCLLLAGRRDRAREAFISSYQFTQRNPPHHRFNSAVHYLQWIPW